MVNEELVTGVRTVCDVVETALGPFGANKLLIQRDGTVTATASSTELLDRFDVSDPAVTLLDTAASDFHDAYGDGTGTVVTLVGALLREADRLVERGLHPTAIERGFREGLDVALDAVDGAAHPLSAYEPDDVARTALTATRNPAVRRSVSAQVADAVAEAGPEARDRVQVVSRTGGATAETDLVSGVVIERGPVLESMPRSQHGTGIAVLSSTVDVPHAGSQLGRVSRRVTLDADSFEDREALRERESEAFDERLAAAVDAGCGVVITERAINERVESALAAAGILGVHRVDADVVDRVARATGATVVPTLEQVSAATLGTGDVDVRRKAGRDMTFVTSDAGEPTHTLFCRAPDPRTVRAFERSVEAAIAATAAATRDGRVVPGGGAIEATAARAVDRAARSLSGRQQLAADGFGNALLSVPRALAATAGVDAGQAEVRLRVARTEGRDAVGIDVLAGTTADVLGESPVVEPASLKAAVLTTAAEAAIQLIRIDERLDATDLGDEEEIEPETESADADADAEAARDGAP
ncbi:TCP-1/cpn60 chaperonin family protein [Haloplanus salinarum]|jgi:chaperonin GroEL (HSP60 family)|uniref:TCP-1/cpn60 chaperonin family protein n=1 Tax=Haloplanus salinarum TaxID=1912324 RepID=UPI00214CA92A|nr:TCP-1/cpn60 chaperonin family protein [Haloplanus salinarum]